MCPEDHGHFSGGRAGRRATSASYIPRGQGVLPTLSSAAVPRRVSRARGRATAHYLTGDPLTRRRALRRRKPLIWPPTHSCGAEASPESGARDWRHEIWAHTACCAMGSVGGRVHPVQGPQEDPQGGDSRLLYLCRHRGRLHDATAEVCAVSRRLFPEPGARPRGCGRGGDGVAAGGATTRACLAARLRLGRPDRRRPMSRGTEMRAWVSAPVTAPPPASPR